MSLELCVLGSGSSGNSSLVRLGGAAALIDAGFGPRATAKRLDGTGVGLGDIRAIVLTHLDRDHFAPTWFKVLVERGIHVYLAERHVALLYQSLKRYGADGKLLHKRGLLHTFNGRAVDMAGDCGIEAELQPVHLAHDRTGTVGYVLQTPRHRLGYATDLGRITERLREALLDVDVLAIESNYDRDLELASGRPPMLKDRIMSGRGHLSNDEAFEMVCHVFDRSGRPPRHVLLLHLSRQCNCPTIVRELYERRADIAARLCVTNQSRRTEWLRVEPGVRPLRGEQAAMFG